MVRCLDDLAERPRSSMLGIRPQNLEPWQVTRYAKGQRFDFHLDCGCWRDDASGDAIRAARRRGRALTIYPDQQWGCMGRRRAAGTLPPCPPEGCGVIFKSPVARARCTSFALNRTALMAITQLEGCCRPATASSTGQPRWRGLWRWYGVPLRRGSCLRDLPSVSLSCKPETRN